MRAHFRATTLPPFLHSYLSGKSSYNFKAPPTPVATADAVNETQANSVKSFIRSVDLEGQRDWFAREICGSMLTQGSHMVELIS